MKRLLYIIHRWLGILLSLFMAMWFFSGVVMMYVGYPKLSFSEKLAALPKLDSTQCCADLATVLQQAPESGKPDNLRLTTIAGTPTYILGFDKNIYLAVNGLSGLKVTNISAETARFTAQKFLQTDGEYLGSVNEDAWTHSRALDGQRPLHKVQMHDANNTLLYVSGVTGEVVRDATGTERFWNWVGAWIHWLYPFRGGFFEAQAANIVIYTSLVGCFLTLSGLITGVLRWRFRGQYKHGSKTPYRGTFMRWHHLFGLGFGVIAFTWILSGLFSMNPWKIFEPSPQKLNMRAYALGELEASHFPLSVQSALSRYQANGFYPVEVEWRLLDGKGYYMGFNNAGQSSILLAEADAAPMAQFPPAQLKLAAKRLMPDAKLIKSSLLTAYDAYFYQRTAHTMNGHIEKRLPMLRLEFDDEFSTWIQIDLFTGAPQKLDSYKRTSRWLFAFLHSWDWLPLLNSRPLWDILLICLSIGGFIISISGIIIGWKRVERKLGQLSNVNT